ncbi:CRISPR-associated helicase Cas3' [Natronoglycomyces albus]|uniref:CRISPR-associated helicase Cas3 n=1 Tax=Natronoglycomyces albus TaxID=2811108 RepID=A0A895XSP2_9ACTN|nr:CRISPR-associated helicase Cas3' [Natronoglycomyces albus]QSB06523.1 CRISPR-associated helicase Cas3' [Natronoglycomyces albus]
MEVLLDEYLVDLNIWGKSRGLNGDGEGLVTYPLVCHLIDASAFAGQVWDLYLSARLRVWLADQLSMSPQECRAFLMLLAGLHDVGKACPGFQRQLVGKEWSLPEGYLDEGDFRDHAMAGQLWLGAALAQKFEWHEDLAAAVAEVVGGHHGVFTFVKPLDYNPVKLKPKGLGVKAWGRQRVAMVTLMRRLVGPRRLPDRFPAEAQVLACAVVVLADWLASQSSYIKRRMADVPERGETAALAEFFEESAKAASVELNAAGLTRLVLAEGSFTEEFGFAPNRLQRSLETGLPGAVTGPGLLIVTEQTGLGKTEATLFASRLLAEASGSAGLAFLLPTMATSNAMEHRLVDYFERRAVGPASLNLVHSMAWLRRLREEREPQEATLWANERELTEVTEWLSGGKKAAFAPVCVGTIDQALLSVLPLKHNAFRMLAFANKTVVIDEVHAFDAYVRRLLCGFLAWCGHLGVPVVLMSATLSQPIARELAAAYLGRPSVPELELAYPGWAFVERGMSEPVVRSIPVDEADQRPLRIELRECATGDDGLDRGAALREVLTPLCQDRGSAAVVCTTVKEAQRTYLDVVAWVQEEGFDAEVVLLHSNMPLWQRESITDDIVSRFGKGGDRSGRTIVVSTQVVEQSVDIDMDLVVSDLAPWELLLQRAGRGHRHPQNDGSRPAWASAHRLVVLVPEGGSDPVMPKRWEYVYPPASLIRTHRLLHRQCDEPVIIPSDVQRLVDVVHTDQSLIAGFESAQQESRAREYLQRGEAGRFVVPDPGDFTTVEEYSGQDRLTEEPVTTRFNADSVRALPLFADGDELYLDPEARQPLPRPVRVKGRPRWSQDDLAAIIEHTVPVRRSLIQDKSGDLAAEPFEEWTQHRQLKHVLPLVHQISKGGEPRPARLAGKIFRLDRDLGLVVE